MVLTLNPEVEALVEQQMQGGRFRDENELIATALSVLADNTPDRSLDWDAIIDEGIWSAENEKLYTEEEARAYLRTMREKL